MPKELEQASFVVARRDAVLDAGDDTRAHREVPFTWRCVNHVHVFITSRFVRVYAYLDKTGARQKQVTDGFRFIGKCIT